MSSPWSGPSAPTSPLLVSLDPRNQTRRAQGAKPGRGSGLWTWPLGPGTERSIEALGPRESLGQRRPSSHPAPTPHLCTVCLSLPMPNVSPDVGLRRCGWVCSGQPRGVGKRAKLSPFLRAPELVAPPVWACRPSREKLVCPLPWHHTFSGPLGCPKSPPPPAKDMHTPTPKFPFRHRPVPSLMASFLEVCFSPVWCVFSNHVLSLMGRITGFLGEAFWGGHDLSTQGQLPETGDRPQDRVRVPWGHPVTTVRVKGP